MRTTPEGVRIWTVQRPRRRPSSYVKSVLSAFSSLLRSSCAVNCRTRRRRWMRARDPARTAGSVWDRLLWQSDRLLVRRQSSIQDRVCAFGGDAARRRADCPRLLLLLGVSARLLSDGWRPAVGGGAVQHLCPGTG